MAKPFQVILASPNGDFQPNILVERGGPVHFLSSIAFVVRCLVRQDGDTQIHLSNPLVNQRSISGEILTNMPQLI